MIEQEQKDRFHEAAIQVISAQRNAALDQVATFAGRLAVAEAALAEANRQIDTLTYALNQPPQEAPAA